MFSLLKSRVPLRIRWALHRWRENGDARYCPICSSHVRAFYTAGLVEKRPDSKCPVCLSLERHRLAWYFMEKRTNLLDGKPKKFLHIAPEPAIAVRLSEVHSLSYLTADLNSSKTMIQMDITDIQYPEASFDIIFCSHVLEHVPNDRRALAEFFRVLKPHGWMVILVPVVGEITQEDFSITNPHERLRLYGQEDHVRIYGRDFIRRICDIGFETCEYTAEAVAGKDLVKLMGLKHETLFYATKSNK
jgi:SAM-dependent methyltransferase